MKTGRQHSQQATRVALVVALAVAALLLAAIAGCGTRTASNPQQSFAGTWTWRNERGDGLRITLLQDGTGTAWVLDKSGEQVKKHDFSWKLGDKNRRPIVTFSGSDFAFREVLAGEWYCKFDRDAMSLSTNEGFEGARKYVRSIP